MDGVLLAVFVVMKARRGWLLATAANGGIQTVDELMLLLMLRRAQMMVAPLMVVDVLLMVVAGRRQGRLLLVGSGKAAGHGRTRCVFVFFQWFSRILFKNQLYNIDLLDHIRA